MLSPLAAMLACTFLLGMIVAIWQRIPWVFSQRLKIPEAMCRGWQAWFALPLIFLFPLLGHWIDSWNSQSILFFGILGFALSLALLGQHRTLRGGLTALLVLCLSIPCVALPIITLLPRAFPEYKPVLVLNIAFAGVILGMALTPGMVKMVVQKLAVRHGFLALALVCLLPALLVALTPEDNLRDGREPGPWSDVLQDGSCWLLALTAFTYYLLADLLGKWKKAYLSQAPDGMPWVNLVFWLMLGAGLPIAGWMTWNHFEPWGLAVLAVVYAVVLGNMASDFFSRRSVFGMWIAAGFFAPMLPTLLAIQLKSSNDNPSGTLGLALGAGALGQFLSQPILERFAQRKPLASLMWLSAVLALAMAAMTLGLALLMSPPTTSHRRPNEVRKPHRPFWPFHRLAKPRPADDPAKQSL